MGKRGRPKHPDILTLREWEVLALLREGLSNEQIAERLGVSLAGAKYHVSEILSKLGVSSREEAVRWSPERRPWWAGALAPVASLWRKASASWAAGAVAAGVFVLIAAGIGVLVWGLVRTSEDGIDETSQAPVVPAVSPSTATPSSVEAPSATIGDTLNIALSEDVGMSVLLNAAQHDGQRVTVRLLLDSGETKDSIPLSPELLDQFVLTDEHGSRAALLEVSEHPAVLTSHEFITITYEFDSSPEEVVLSFRLAGGESPANWAIPLSSSLREFQLEVRTSADGALPALFRLSGQPYEGTGSTLDPLVLKVMLGDTVRLTVTNLDPAEPHRLVSSDLGLDIGPLSFGESGTVEIEADRPGIFEFVDPMDEIGYTRGQLIVNATLDKIGDFEIRASPSTVTFDHEGQEVFVDIVIQSIDDFDLPVSLEVPVRFVAADGEDELIFTFAPAELAPETDSTTNANLTIKLNRFPIGGWACSTPIITYGIHVDAYAANRLLRRSAPVEIRIPPPEGFDLSCS